MIQMPSPAGFNLPPGVTLRDIDPPDDGLQTCGICCVVATDVDEWGVCGKCNERWEEYKRREQQTERTNKCQ